MLSCLLRRIMNIGDEKIFGLYILHLLNWWMDKRRAYSILAQKVIGDDLKFNAGHWEKYILYMEQDTLSVELRDKSTCHIPTRDWTKLLD